MGLGFRVEQARLFSPPRNVECLRVLRVEFAFFEGLEIGVPPWRGPPTFEILEVA